MSDLPNLNSTDLLEGAYARDPQAEARFWAKVDKSGGCWQWTAGKSDGYGSFALTPRNIVRAHRVAYTWLVGPIPDGLVLDHLCRNRGCVNPTHLEPVTSRINSVRGETDKFRAYRAGTCTKGHELTPENTVVEAGGARRRCRKCKNAAWLRWHHKRAGKA